MWQKLCYLIPRTKFRRKNMPFLKQTPTTRRIMVTLPETMIDRLDEYVNPRERSALVEEALEAHLAKLDAAWEREQRSEARRERIDAFWGRLRQSSRKAAQSFLP